MDSIIGVYRGCEIRLGSDGWHYACRTLPDRTIQYLCHAEFASYTFSDRWGSHAKFYGPESPREAIDKALDRPAG